MKFFLLLALVALGGCAKFPTTGADVTSTRVVFSMDVAGKIRTGREPENPGLPYVYIIAINTSNDRNPTTVGPIPVVAPPWGNGFVAPQATHYILWDPTQPTEYTIYRFNDANLEQWTATGVPISSEPVSDGSKRIRFEIGLSQLIPSPADLANLQSLQVNFLTMDRVPQSGTSKFWDALGDGRLATEINSPITIPSTVSGTYNNLRNNNLEPTGDQPNPDLDITDWQIEVRTQ